MKLTEISSKNSWIWSCSTPHYGTTSSKVVTGSDNGDIEVLDLRFDNIYAINPERYAYRENLTEIVVQHLFTDRKVRIKCRDLVKKLALYKNKLAVQVSDKVFIYESNSEDLNDIHFRLKKERVTYNIESSSMGIIINYLLFSHQNTVSTYTFDGIKTRTWTFESKVKYFNVDCGLVDKECVIVCLQNGVIYKIFIDNPFPLEISRREPTKIGNKLVAPPSVICADMNLHRNLIATVDEKTNLVVSDLNTHDVLFKYSGAKHVCFNREVDDMLCFSTDVSMYVVSGISGGNKPVVTPSSNFTGVRDRNKSNQKNDEIDIEVRSKAGDEIVPQEQHIGGPATALVFSGQRLFCLYRGLMTNLDIPQGNNILSAIEANDYDHGYHLACLGATSADWRLLGMRALRANQLNIAKNCFSRLQDTKYLNLLEMIESNRGGIAPAKSPEKRNKNFNLNANTKQIVPPLDNAWVSEILAYEGHALDAAKLCARSGKTTEAVRILTELRRWNDAKLFAQSSNNNSIDLNELTLKQAKWLQEISDWKGAAELHITLGQYMNACKIIVDSNKSNENLGVTNNTWKSYLLDVMRRTPKELTDVLTYCGDTFVEVDEDEMAKETYTKLNDISKLMYLFGRKQMWVEAAKLAEDHPGEFDCSVFLPYAEWLVSQDQFMDAVNAYKKANRSDLARKILEELTYNSVVESRFKDAAYFYWLLSREYESLALELMNSNNNLNASMGSKHASLTIEQCELSQMEAEHKADLYYAYSTIHSYIMDPFTTHLPDTLFQVCRFIINSIGEHNNAVVPYGISKASTYYTLGKQAMKIGCFKLARYAYEKLNKLTLTLKTHEAEIDLDMLIIQAKPIHDNPDYSPACYRCGAMNPLLNPFTNKHAKGDVCSSCGHPFVRSFISFDILPLVEFVPEPSISDDEAIELIRSPNDSNAIADMKLHSMKGERDGWKESKDEKTNANIMSLDDEPEEYNDAMLTGNSRMSSGFNDDYAGGGFGSQHGVDLFTRCLNRTIDKQVNDWHIYVKWLFVSWNIDSSICGYRIMRGTCL